jgi:hypothetical protein
MVTILSKSGKQIGRISDSLDQDDTLVLDGQNINLSDVYNDEKLVKQFNKNVKALRKEIKDVQE